MKLRLRSKRSRVTGMTCLVIVTLWGAVKLPAAAAAPATPQSRWWQFQSIDTMKYSRDQSRANLDNPGFDATIDQQVRAAAQTGATHVALGTPYDPEFLPILRRWVAAARKHKLQVWFRGNWAGWEGWFGYARMTRTEHLTRTRDFILANSDLFRDGDMFTPCPECENGGPGDPRQTGDVAGHRQFLIDEFVASNSAFRAIGRRVHTRAPSMNADVARLIMDKKTTRALGGVVGIDHYVKTPEQLVRDIKSIHKQSGGKILLSEFGAPIPDIHGRMTPAQQAAWIDSAWRQLVPIREVIGINYWVGVGGSTALWSDQGRPRPAVDTVKTFFKPKQLVGTVRNQFRQPVTNATVSGRDRVVTTQPNGSFQIPVLDGRLGPLTITSPNSRRVMVGVAATTAPLTIILKRGK